ncbi:MAG: prenyltransferase [Bradymonadales bacterium]|nr:MAG: prenyltransferase [Bradymonadales bacterium]
MSILELKRNEKLFQELMESGVLKTSEGERFAQLVRFVDLQDSNQSYGIFQVTPVDQLKRPGLHLRVLSSLRAYSFSATLGVGICVVLFGIQQGWDLNLLAASLGGFITILLHSSINLYNDYADYQRLIDLPGTPGGSGAIQKAWLSPRCVKRLALGCLLLALASSLWLGLLQKWPLWLWVVGAVSCLGVLSYSGGNFRFGVKYIALGEALVFAMCGPLLGLAFSYVSFGTFNSGVMYISSALGMFAVGLLFCNNLQDIPQDQARGAMTLAQIMGFSKAQKIPGIIYGLGLLTLGIGLATHILPFPIVLAGLVAFPSFKLSRKLSKASGPFSIELESSRLEAAKIHGQLSLSISIALLIALLF